ncbi:hypothetical protein Bca52824_079459 [Brassica carinata]|uniref:Uncharacterized protein n=1 Tax=Brassica carinata TaxID=52824 RepID=A0A8X7PYM1_BRACI|nr:hypothetical protein Bca52824_079459 [Brassica carinata]
MRRSHASLFFFYGGLYRDGLCHVDHMGLGSATPILTRGEVLLVEGSKRVAFSNWNGSVNYESFGGVLLI